ncbi:MAG: archease [Nitrospirae bacterium]|nr:archease [Nitrospirota bacterium]
METVAQVHQFEIIDISGDVGVRAYGSDLESLFIHAASGMYSLITDPELIREEGSIELEVRGSTLEGLMVSWLNELVFQFDANNFIGKRVIIHELSTSDEDPDAAGGFRIRGTLYGEDFDISRHERRLLIKAATYHKLEIVRENASFRADIIFDI